VADCSSACRLPPAAPGASLTDQGHVHRAPHRRLGAALGATGANDFPGFQTAMNNEQERGRGHGPI
jgi:hypothetical protein